MIRARRLAGKYIKGHALTVKKANTDNLTRFVVDYLDCPLSVFFSSRSEVSRLAYDRMIVK
jgi:hypothetical protein